MTSKTEYTKQVDSSHYAFSSYFFPARFMSYWYQIKEITSRPEITSVLDVGPGTDMLRFMLQIHAPHITYTTVDIATDVKPDLIGSVTKLPLTDNAVDAACAFQVLEHIKFADFVPALLELRRVSKQYVLISLPHFGPSFELHFKIPFLPRVRLACKVPWKQPHAFQGQHYWEIGKKGFPVHAIRAIMSEHFTIVDEYVPFENQYHHFYILAKK